MRVRSLPNNIITVLLGLLAFAAPASAQTSDTGGAQPTDSGYTTPVTASGGREYGTEDPTLKPVVAGSVATLQADGLAAAPLDAPPEVQNAIWAANQIIGLPYVYGGGHGNFKSRGYDCSGTVSFALHGASLLRSPLDSGSFMRWGLAGKGTWFTVYTNPGHAFAVIAGLRLDTSPAGDRGGLRGPRWRPVLRSTHGFKARHPLGF